MNCNIKKSWKKLEAYQKWSLFFTFLIVIITAIYSVFSGLQWQEMKRTSKATEDATTATKEAIQLTEAADVEGDHIACSPETHLLSQDSSVTFILKNSGRTRADQVKLTFTLGIVGRPLKPDPMGKPKPIAIAPGHTVSTQPLIVRNEVSESDWANVVASRVQLHFRGHASYRDVFGNHHCYVWDSIYIPKTKCDFGMTNIYNAKECPKDDLH